MKENCAICQEPLPQLPSGFIRHSCCGVPLHAKCERDMLRNPSVSDKMKKNCFQCGGTLVLTEADEIKQLEEHAVNNEAWAQLWLGIYSKDKNQLQKAKEYYEDAANQGMAAAQYALGGLYLKGNGVQRNYDKALEYFKRAANQGMAAAQYALGDLYLKGNGVQRNYDKALEYFKRAANQGFTLAQSELMLIATVTNTTKDLVLKKQAASQTCKEAVESVEQLKAELATAESQHKYIKHEIDKIQTVVDNNALAFEKIKVDMKNKRQEHDSVVQMVFHKQEKCNVKERELNKYISTHKTDGEKYTLIGLQVELAKLELISIQKRRDFLLDFSENELEHICTTLENLGKRLDQETETKKMLMSKMQEIFQERSLIGDLEEFDDKIEEATLRHEQALAAKQAVTDELAVILEDIRAPSEAVAKETVEAEAKEAAEMRAAAAKEAEKAAAEAAKEAAEMRAAAAKEAEKAAAEAAKEAEKAAAAAAADKIRKNKLRAKKRKQNAKKKRNKAKEAEERYGMEAADEEAAEMRAEMRAAAAAEAAASKPNTQSLLDTYKEQKSLMEKAATHEQQRRDLEISAAKGGKGGESGEKKLYLRF